MAFARCSAQESQLMCQDIKSQALGNELFSFSFYANLELQYCSPDTDGEQGLFLY